ncbi:MAG: GyrI-like domain-containing protein [Acidobacteriota bacterium]
MKANTEKKIDFAKSHKDLYSATRKIKEVTPGWGVFLSVDEKGAPGGAAFQSDIEKLYSLVYTLKFGIAKPKGLDFKVGSLECLYHTDPCTKPKEEWEWQLMIRIPDEISEDDVQQAREAVLRRKELDTSSVKRIQFEEGRCLQTLHVGPYDQVNATYDVLLKHSGQQGLAPSGAAHEIYISDPRRVPPERLKTIVRLPVS